jgi:drug/metabolite transporter (DMT)-like permease
VNWQIFIAISIIASAFAALLQKLLMQKDKINPIVFAAGFQIMTGLLIGIVVLFNGFRIPNLAPIWLNLLFMPILYSLGNIAKFQSLKRIDASEFTVIYQASTLVTVLVAVMFLGEIFKVCEVIGLALIIIAILLVTFKKRITFKLSRGEFWALSCAAAYGLAFANDAYILRTFDLWTYTFLAFLIPGILTLIYLGRKAKQVTYLFEKGSLWGFLSSVFIYGTATITMYAAYQVGRNAAQIASITPTYSILIVILAAIFLKERDYLPRKLIAAALAIAGIILLR